MEQERERLIGNATNLSIALAENRTKVDELMKQLGPNDNKNKMKQQQPPPPPKATAAAAAEMPSRVTVTGIHHPKARPGTSHIPPPKASTEKCRKKRFV